MRTKSDIKTRLKKIIRDEIKKNKKKLVMKWGSKLNKKLNFNILYIRNGYLIWSISFLN